MEWGGGVTHSEEQGGDGSAACYVNHGQQTWEVALSGSGKEEPAKEGQRHNEATIQLTQRQKRNHTLR